MSNKREIFLRGVTVSKCGLGLPAALTCSLLLHLAVLLSPAGNETRQGVLPREALQVVIALAQTTGEVRTTRPKENPERSVVTDARSPATADEPAATPAPELRTIPQEATPPVLIAEPILPKEFPLGNENGFAVLELSIDSDGRIVQVVTLDTDLANEYATAIESLSREALFEPARLGGKAAPGRSIIRFEYHPAEPEPLRFQWIPDYQLNSG